VKKIMSLILAIAVLAVFSFGCADMVSKETKVKCPKCGAVFTVDEGIKSMQGGVGEAPSK
jgi:hypothetical protein